MVYQEMTSLSEITSENSRDTKNKTGLICVLNDSHPNRRQDENHGHLGKVLYSSADLEQSTAVMNFEENMSQSSFTHRGKESLEESALKIFQRDENVGEAQVQEFSTRDPTLPKSEVKGFTILDHEHTTLNTDGEERGMHAKIADHEKQLMELQEQV